MAKNTLLVEPVKARRRRKWRALVHVRQAPGMFNRAFANARVLLVVMCSLRWEALDRLQPAAGWSIVVAGLMGLPTTGSASFCRYVRLLPYGGQSATFHDRGEGTDL